MTQSEIRSLVIAGGGTAGWMTAAAMVRVFGPRVAITLIESDDIGTIGVGEATIPPIALFNKLIKIDENDFLRQTQGTFKLGIEFDGWRREGHRYLHAFGTLGKDLAHIPFHHYWLDAVQNGREADLWAYSLNAQASERNRFDRLDRIPDSPLPGLVHAFHFDAGLYARYLRRIAEAGGVRRVEGKIVAVDQNAETGDVTALCLENGATIAADFFVDCSGFRGLLINETLKADFIDFGHLLPCDRAWAVPTERTSPLTPYTRSTARKAGWQWRIPLQHRTGNGHVYASSHMADAEAADLLMSSLDGKPLAEPRLVKFRTGYRKTAWSHNVVSIGLASGFIEPLESTAIHLIQSSIERLILMFPQKTGNDKTRDAFNRLNAAQYEYIKDFIVLHYFANERLGDPFWDMMRNLDIPSSLAEKLELFKEAGAIFSEPHDLFQLPSWLQVMWGQGITPKAHHPFVQTVAPHDRADYLQSLRQIIARGWQALPSHADFIDRHCKAPST